MRYVSIYATPDGESHFADVEVAMMPGGFAAAHRCAPFLATGAFFVHVPEQPADDRQWHTAPRRQFVMTLSGQLEVETSDGEVRRTDAATVVLAEDTTGKGHKTRSLTAEALLAVVPLAE